MKNKQKIVLNEAQLKKMIREAIISELDWKTYDSAMRKAAQRGEWDRAGKFGDASKKAFNDDFGSKGSVYDYRYKRMSVPFEQKKYYDNKKDDWVYKDGTDSHQGWYQDEINAAHDDPSYHGSTLAVPHSDYSFRRKPNGQIEANAELYRERSKPYNMGKRFFYEPDDEVEDNRGNIWTDDSSLADATAAARRGGRETLDYLKGNYEYQKGKGWQLKENKMNRIIKESIKKVLKEHGWDDFDMQDTNWKTGESKPYVGRELNEVIETFTKRGYKHFPDLERRQDNGTLITTLVDDMDNPRNVIYIASVPENETFIVKNVSGQGESSGVKVNNKYSWNAPM